MPIQLPFDLYNFRARQNPVTVTLAPAVFAALAAVPSLQGTWGFLGGIVAAFGLPYVLAQAAGDAGKRLEPKLYAAWDGMPSVAMLRHRDTRVDPFTKRAYFDALRRVGIPMPTPDEEARDPTATDKAYEAASAWLRKETRDGKAYPRVKTQLINYGLARNLLGLKWLGIAVAIACMLVQAAWVAMPVINGSDAAPLSILSLAFCTMMAGFWIWKVSPRWVRRAADAYTLALLEACERRQTSAVAKNASSGRKTIVRNKPVAAPVGGIAPQALSNAPVS